MRSSIRTISLFSVAVAAFVFLTCLPAMAQTATAGQLIISEFRHSGPNGSKDEFIEIYNASGADHVVTPASGTGYGVAASDGTIRCSLLTGTFIPNRGHFLCVNSSVGGYSLSTYPGGNFTTATPDATFTMDIPDNAGIAIFNNNLGGANFSLDTRLDAVGSSTEADALYKEGAGYPAISPPAATDYSFHRDSCGKGGSMTIFGPCTTGGFPVDTDNNASDFIYAATNGQVTAAGQRLGAAGPENRDSPIQRNDGFTANVLDQCVDKAAPPNRVRDFTADAPNNSTFGTLDLRHTIVNNTGFPVTRLRFRIIDITTFSPIEDIADLRARTSTLVTVTVHAEGCAGSTTVPVQGTTLEEPPIQGGGGGFNSTLSAGTITLQTPLANGASINVRFLLGVEKTGRFKIYLNIEAVEFGFIEGVKQKTPVISEQTSTSRSATQASPRAASQPSSLASPVPASQPSSQASRIYVVRPVWTAAQEKPKKKRRIIKKRRADDDQSQKENRQ